MDLVYVLVSTFLMKFGAISLPGPLMQYKDLVKQGKLQHDPDQEKVALELESLLGRLQQYEKDMEKYHVINYICVCTS